jgi:hypothetical protein
LYSDILSHIRDWQICASLDGTGPTGEYIRTGLNYDQWLENFKEGLQYATHRRQMRIDFTLTLPGLFEVVNIQKLADELEVDILAKVVFSFTPDIIMSPLALPRQLLDKIVDRLITQTSGAMRDVLLQLKNRPVFAEQWPDTFTKELARGKARMLQLDTIRGGMTFADILQQDLEIYEWYKQIP